MWQFIVLGLNIDIFRGVFPFIDINIWITHVWQECSRILQLVMQYLHILTTFELTLHIYVHAHYITIEVRYVLDGG